MQTVELVELIAAGAVTSILGLVVLTRDTRQWTLRLFCLLCQTVALWSWGIACFIFASTAQSMLLWANFYYTCAFAIVLAIHIFDEEWLHHQRRRTYAAASLVVFLVFVVFLCFQPHTVIRSISVQSGRHVSLNPIGYSFYSIVFITLFASGVIRLLIGLKQLRGAYRTQTMYIVTGLIFSGLFGAFFNLFLPWLGNYSLVWIGPLSAVIFVVFVSYAIVRQKLFDIRTFALRAAAYLFSMVLVTLVYVVPVILLMFMVIPLSYTWPHVLWGGVLAIAFVMIYERIRIAFNTLTNKVFFRGYYEPQDVLHRLSEVLVRSIEVSYIKLQSARILQQAIRPGKVGFWLVSDEDYSQHYPTLIAKLFHGKHTTNVLVVSEHETPPVLAAYLASEDVAVLVRLQTARAELGYMALSYKESGAPYNERDRRLLNTVCDEIAIALQNALHFQQIQHFNQTLQDKVAIATKELRRSNEKLKALDATKDEFITMASHQLRTPLTSVKGYLSMVLEGDAGKLNAQQKQLLTQSFISSQRMVFLISDLLNLSRLNTGKFVIESRRVQLTDVVDSEISQLRETAQSREVTLLYEKPENFPWLMLDETKIHQVVMNFLDNAIYYTRAGGTVTISLSETATAVQYTVKDNGIGVPKQDQHKLFTKFYRAQNAQAARPDGTGIGLFMAKKVIAAQGGAIIFESEEGKGSTFGFRFSKAQHLAPDPDSTHIV